MSDAAALTGRNAHVVLDPELDAELEGWRRAQPRVPTVSAAIRHLLARGLESERAASQRSS
jgi:hypothetical protein